jgi:biopolymer transport protein ExbB
MHGFSLDELSAFLSADDPILVLMLASSVIIVAIALERWLAVRRVRVALARVDDKVLAAARQGNLDEARRLCESVGAPIGDVFAVGLDRALGRVKGQPRSAMGRGQKRVAASLRAVVWTLGTAGALMPFVGLLGTVVGVMASFKAIGESGAGGFAIVSAGISAALVATAAGLFVALEAVVLFNILNQRIAATVRELALLVDETLELIDTHAGPADRN